MVDSLIQEINLMIMIKVLDISIISNGNNFQSTAVIQVIIMGYSGIFKVILIVTEYIKICKRNHDDYCDYISIVSYTVDIPAPNLLRVGILYKL